MPLALLASILLAQTAADPKTTFEKVYNQLSTLTIKKDAAGLEKLFKITTTSDFVYYPTRGKKLTAKELIAAMKEQMRTVGKVAKSTQKLDKIVLKGDTAIVTVSAAYAMDVPVKGKAGKLAGTSLTTDTWVNTPKGWRLKEIKTLKETATLNGKAIQGG